MNNFQIWAYRRKLLTKKVSCFGCAYSQVKENEFGTRHMWCTFNAIHTRPYDEQCGCGLFKPTHKKQLKRNVDSLIMYRK